MRRPRRPRRITGLDGESDAGRLCIPSARLHDCDLQNAEQRDLASFSHVCYHLQTSSHPVRVNYCVAIVMHNLWSRSADKLDIRPQPNYDTPRETWTSLDITQRAHIQGIHNLRTLAYLLLPPPYLRPNTTPSTTPIMTRIRTGSLALPKLYLAKYKAVDVLQTQKQIHFFLRAFLADSTARLVWLRLGDQQRTITRSWRRTLP